MSIFGGLVPASSSTMENTPGPTNPRPNVNDTPSEPPTKRRRLAEPYIPLGDISADVFFSKITGEMVLVHVEGHDLKLPKDLLCYHSPFFYAAFNSGFAESIEKEVSLPECRLDTFKLAIQWMFQGRVVLPTAKAEDRSSIGNPGTSTASVSESGLFIPVGAENTQHTPLASLSPRAIGVWKISKYLEFFECAQYLNLIGPFDSVLADIKSILIQNLDSLEASHLHLAMKLMTGHPGRVLLAQALTKPYVQMLLDRKHGNFRFKNEINSLEGFAADMAKESGKAFGTMTFTVQPNRPVSGKYTITDPLIKESYVLHVRPF